LLVDHTGIQDAFRSADQATGAIAQGGQPSGIELRGAQRFTLLVRTAKLVVDGREYLGVLRDASATGCKMRLFHPLPPGRSLMLETANGDRFPMEMVWYRDDHAGFQFHEPVEVARLIEDNRGPYVKREIRANVSCQAVVQASNRSFAVRVHDISRQGACIESPERMMLRQSLRLDVPGFPKIHAQVCWRQAPRHGLVFVSAFGLEELAGYLRKLQDTVQAASAAAAPPVLRASS